MSQFLNSIKEVKKNYKPYDAWEQNQEDYAAKKIYLSKTLPQPQDKIELTTAKAKTVVHAAEMLDKRSEDNAENMERSFGILSTAVLFPFIFLPSLLKLKFPKLAKSKWIDIANFGIIFGASIGFMLWRNKKQKDASRLGRFQAKQHELKDVKNFVCYTPEQIESAKILVKNMPDIKDKKGIKKAFQDMKQMSLDKKEYKKWLQEKIKNPDDFKKLLNTKFSPEQIKNAEQDKEIILNIVKDVNIEAEKYSENIENAYDTATMLSFIGSIPIAIGINKVLDKIKNVPEQIRGATGPVASTIFVISMIIAGTTAQKEASRVGRFVKRKEIEENPSTLIKYTDEELKKAEHIKAPEQKKGFFAKTLDNLKFFGKYSKDKKAYLKYQKEGAKNNQKLYDALHNVEVTDKQLKEAKRLQEKTFLTFDKVDEMSQRYSEDTEAATEIVKSSFGMIWQLGAMGAIALLAIAVKKGKVPIHKIIKKASDIGLNKDSSVKSLINKGYDIIKNDTTLKQDFCKAIYSQKARKNLANNKELRSIIEELSIKISNRMPEITSAKNPTEAIKECLKRHFKQDPVSRWIQGLSTDISKLWFKNKIKKIDVELPKEIDDKIKFDLIKDFKSTCKNYKTLITTGALTFIPGLGLLIGIPFAFSSWLTNIQKKAGKIGIMKAMDELKDPAYYADIETVNNGQQTTDPQKTVTDTSLIDKFKNK